MEFVADESVEAPLVARLRDAGHAVAYIAEDMPGAPDKEVLATAARLNRILITNDKDFAELTFLQHGAAPGVLLLRMTAARSSAKAARLLEVIGDDRVFLLGRMTVVTADAVRTRRLPHS